MIGLRFFVLSAKALCAFAQLLPPCHRVTVTNQMRYKTTKPKKAIIYKWVHKIFLFGPYAYLRFAY